MSSLNSAISYVLCVDSNAAFNAHLRVKLVWLHISNVFNSSENVHFLLVLKTLKEIDECHQHCRFATLIKEMF